MPKNKKVKKPITPEDRPQYLEAEDYETVRENYTIYKYQREALKRQSKKTGRGQSEIVRMALDGILFKARRHSDFKVGDSERT